MDRLNAQETVINIGSTRAMLQVAQLIAEQTDGQRQNVVREWLYKGAEDAVMHLIEQGEITYSTAAEALDTTIYDIQDEIARRGLDVGLTEEHEPYLAQEHYPKKRG
jgi:hypothetical protein